jgi:hypothetical protein
VSDIYFRSACQPCSNPKASDPDTDDVDDYDANTDRRTTQQQQQQQQQQRNELYLLFQASDTWCEPLGALQSNLLVIQQYLNRASFQHLCHSFCSQLNRHFLDSCLSTASLQSISITLASAKQLKNDIRALISAMRAFVTRPENYFKEYAAAMHGSNTSPMVSTDQQQ